MPFLPPSTNAEYRGGSAPAWFLALAGALTTAAGLVHYLLPDGGAGVIAHVDLATRATTIVALFAWYGAMQIPFGALILVIALRYRPLVPLALVMFFVAQALGAFSAWFWKGSHGGHHPPEHYASAILTGLCPLLLLMAVRGRRAGPR